MFNLSRRAFIANAAAAASARAFAGRAGGAPNVTFGVLSDVHLERPADEDTFLKALAYFRDGGADGVLVAGDIANTGRIEQLKRGGAADCVRRAELERHGLFGADAARAVCVRKRRSRIGFMLRERHSRGGARSRGGRGVQRRHSAGRAHRLRRRA